VVWTWPCMDQPALWLWSRGRWRWAIVRARQDWPDGRVAYQVAVDLDGSTAVRTQAYWWPHEGLRVAHRSAAPASRKPGQGGSMPAPPQLARRAVSRASSMAAAKAESRRRR
jgi:hypothetical protein